MAGAPKRESSSSSSSSSAGSAAWRVTAKGDGEVQLLLHSLRAALVSGIMFLMYTNPRPRCSATAVQGRQVESNKRSRCASSRAWYSGCAYCPVDCAPPASLPALPSLDHHFCSSRPSELRPLPRLCLLRYLSSYPPDLHRQPVPCPIASPCFPLHLDSAITHF